MWTVIMILLVGLFIYPLLFADPAMLGKYNKDLEDIFPHIKKQNHSRCLEDGVIYFPSRRSAALTILICLALLSSLIQAALYRQFETLISILMISMIIIWLDRTTGYTISSTHLLIKCAIFSREVNLEMLRKVSRSNNPLSAPALSLKRMEIVTTDGGMMLISPVEEELFLRILKERSSNLTVDW